MGVDRLYYRDPYLTRFEAAVVSAGDGGRRLYLDRTAFYPASGGQPHDLGRINGTPVVEVIDEDDRIAHVLAAPVTAATAACEIDWARRFDHMQQHTGQHLLSAVLVELYGAQTVGFHLGADYATIDVTAAAFDTAAIEARANAIVFENRPVAVSFEATPAGLRKPSGRAGTLRIISIEGLDRSACGGTHVRATGEIGPILIRKVDRAHGNARIEFLCGMRAVRRAHADYEALVKIARRFSAPLDETPTLVAGQAEALAAAERARRKLAVELAQVRGRELYAAASPGPDGVRRHDVRVCALDDEVRAAAQAFTSGSKAVYLAVVDDPPSVLLAASADSGLHAGNAVKSAVAAAGGRGGGNAQIAQGSVPSREALESVLRKLR